MMPSQSPAQFLFAGTLQRDFFISAENKVYNDVMGGNLLYSAAGFKIWERGEFPGLVARVSENYPQKWLEIIKQSDFDTRGIEIIPGSMDLRSFYVHTNLGTRKTGDPVPYYAEIGEPFPKALFGYTDRSKLIDSRISMVPTSLRHTNIPREYMDGTAAHLCGLDYLSHSLLPSVLRQNGYTIITVDPSAGYMNPTYWNDIPSLVTGLTAFLPSEEEIRSLFQGRSDDLWEMAKTISEFNCDYVIIKCGSKGQLLYDSTSNTRWEVPPYPARVSNLTGTGDAFCGGFLAGYRRTYDPLQAVLQGNISASLAAEGPGPFYALDTLPNLPEMRLESLRQSVRKIA